MKDKIFSIVKHSAIYSIGNIAQKGMGIITLPIFAHYLSQTDFGIYAIIDITLMILAEVLTLGQANSVILFNNKPEYRDKKKSVFFSITVFVVGVNIIFALLVGFFGVAFLELIKPGSGFTVYIQVLIFVVLLRVINSIFINKIRADEKSLFFTVLTLIKIVFFIGLVIITVVHLNLAVLGIFYSYLFSELIVFLIQLPGMIRAMNTSFDREVVKTALKFGFPLIFSTIGILVLNLSDRYLIGLYVNLKAVGLYDFGYRIAGVIQMFLIMPFNQALLPLVYKEYKTPGDKRYYSKLMTYMCFILVWGSLALAMFSNVIVKILGTNNFGGAEKFVPIIIAAYIFSSMRSVASTGMLLSEKTSYIAVITVAAGILNILLNIFLLPHFGVIAAAYTTLISFIIFYFVTKFYSDKFYNISYESMKIVKLFLVGIVLYILSENVNPLGIILSFSLKIIFVLLFPILMYFLNFYEKIELRTLKTSYKKLRNPFELKNILTNLLSNEKST